MMPGDMRALRAGFSTVAELSSPVTKSDAEKFADRVIEAANAIGEGKLSTVTLAKGVGCCRTTMLKFLKDNPGIAHRLKVNIRPLRGH